MARREDKNARRGGPLWRLKPELWLIDTIDILGQGNRRASARCGLRTANAASMRACLPSRSVNASEAGYRRNVLKYSTARERQSRCTPVRRIPLGELLHSASVLYLDTCSTVPERCSVARWATKSCV